MVVYIAGPYSAPSREEIQQNINIAEQVSKKVLKAGHVPVCPHRISAHWDDDPEFPPEEWPHERFMKEFCIPLLDKCDAILLLPNWKESKGTMMEFKHAIKNRKIILKADFWQTV